jgi:hypothetical protein
VKCLLGDNAYWLVSTANKANKSDRLSDLRIMIVRSEKILSDEFTGKLKPVMIFWCNSRFLRTILDQYSQSEASLTGYLP